MLKNKNTTFVWKLLNATIRHNCSDGCGTGTDPFDKMPATEAYRAASDLQLTEEQLVLNGFPRPSKVPDHAVITPNKYAKRFKGNRRICCRCRKGFSTAMYEKDCINQCCYHPRGLAYSKGSPGNFHRCCNQPAGSPGCTHANYHVTDFVDYRDLPGFVTTTDRDADHVPTKSDIFAIDCEMCYTINGLELTRVTVVDTDCRTVYDTLVKPDNKIIDYNTIYSGITEAMLTDETCTLQDVQSDLLAIFNANTILVGHSLESDFKALKLIHSVVVDTSVLFANEAQPLRKRGLKALALEYLQREIQDSDCGHNSAEDAEVCILLLKAYLRNCIRKHYSHESRF